MNKILCIVAASLTLGAQAQMEGKLSAPMNTKEGKVVYERVMQLGIARFGGSGNLPPEVQAQLDKMPKSRTDQFELMFTPQHSIYQYLPNAADDGGNSTFSGGGAVIQMRAPGINDVSYVNFTNGTRSEQREIMEKSYVVIDTPARLQWKLSDETKPILNFIARKATATTINQRPVMSMENGEMKREMRSDTAKVTAWYTTDIPVPAGPNYAGQLPGLILELDVNNGQSVIRAVEFSPKVSANKIKEPKDGKKLSNAEYVAEREKVMDEMRKNMPAGNRIRMQ
ncbi:MAG: GLPGLI family protein [Chitinophagaceae bacterium]|nr:MAG: GLPGLI family protein [Chitinophagaceae bacterium]